MIWTDCDREGEAIGFDVVECVGNNKEVFRARFSALTKQDIEHAIQNLEKPQQSLADAVRVRQEVDLRVGASFTRFQTLTLRNYLSGARVISYGPC